MCSCRHDSNTVVIQYIVLTCTSLESLPGSYSQCVWFEIINFSSNMEISVESLACTLSYFVLFAVQRLYNYEVMFGWCVLVIALLGPLCPYLYLLPCFIVLWRVFVGMNVCTDRKLYIGKYHETGFSLPESDSVQSAHHWIIVVEKGGEYIYSHAVDNVVSGNGIKKPFVKISKDNLSEKYSLFHVGYVTKKAHDEMMGKLVEDEPMRSGNTCQEYAIDLAFQLSASRTYTFFKTMMISRVRSVIFYVVAVLSVVLYLFDYPIAKYINPLVVCNLFVSWELSRIGVHNRRQDGFLPVLRAFFHYPKPCQFALLILIFGLLVVMHYMKYDFLETFIFALGLFALSSVIAVMIK